MKKAFVSITTVVALLSASAASATECSTQTVAGRWFGGDSFAVCRMDFRDNGRIRGFCEDFDEYFDNGEWYQAVETFSVRGSYNIDTECKMRLRLIIEEDDDEFVVVFHGRLTGAASDRPDIAILSTKTGTEQGLNITMHRD